MVELDKKPDNTDAQLRREIAILDMEVIGLLPQKFREESNEIAKQSREFYWYRYL